MAMGIMEYLTVYVALVFVVISYSSGQPVLQPLEIDISVNQGNDAFLPCIVNGMDTSRYSLIWQDPRQSVISRNDRLHLSSRKYKLVRPYPTDWNLQIINARSEDSGTYTCSVNTPSVQTSTVRLHINVPASVVSSGSAQAALGTDVTLSCTASGVPQPSIWWYKDGTKLNDESNPELVLRGVTLHSAGTYTCTADNGVGAADQATMQVDVLFSPVVKARYQRIAQYLSKDVVVECEVTANPTATVTWYKDATVINPTWKYKIENMSSSDGMILHILTIGDLDSRDFGDYICMAANKIGSRSEMITVLKLETNTAPATKAHVQTTSTPKPTSSKPVKQTTRRAIPSESSTMKYNGKDTDSDTAKENGLSERITDNGSPALWSSYIRTTLIVILLTLIIS